MKNFLEKMLSSKGGKIALCVIIAIPVFICMMYLKKEPEVKVPVVIVEEKEEISETTKPKDEETTPEEEEEEDVNADGEITVDELLANLRVENNKDSRFVSNSVFAIGIWEIKDLTLEELNTAAVKEYDTTLKKKMQQKYYKFEKKELKDIKMEKIIFDELPSKDGVIDMGIVNGYKYFNIYKNNNEGKLCVINVVLFADSKLIVDTVSNKLGDALKAAGIDGVDDIIKILKGEDYNV